MKALLLAAGLGTRLRPLTESIPKCLVQIKDKPLLSYWLDLLLENGIVSVLINTHYLARKVEEFVSYSEWKNEISLVYEEDLLGTGGTILKNRDYFGTEAFMVAHADNLTNFDVHQFLKKHKERPANIIMTMLTFTTDRPETCGIVEVGTDGIVYGFYEKIKDPPSNLANGAVYIFEPEIFDILEKKNKDVIDLSTEIIPGLLGRIQTFHNTKYHRDIGTPDNLQKANKDVIDIEGFNAMTIQNR